MADSYIEEVHQEITALITTLFPEVLKAYRVNTAIKNNWVNAIEKINEGGDKFPPYIVVERDASTIPSKSSADALAYNYTLHIWYFLVEGSAGTVTIGAGDNLDNYLTGKLETLAEHLSFDRFTKFQVCGKLPFINFDRKSEAMAELNKAKISAVAGCVSVDITLGIFQR